MTSREKIKLMQSNICGVSNHSRLALTQYFDQCSPQIVALNETKQDLKIDSFSNYRTESAIRQNKSEGVQVTIACITREYPAK